MAKCSLVWFRQDLRLRDNPALLAAAANGSVIPVFLLHPEEEGAWPHGGASQWWLHHSLQSLQKDLAQCGSRLILRQGPVLAQIQSLIRETGAQNLYFNRRYEPDATDLDKRLTEQLQRSGITVQTYNSRLFFEPWTIANQSGKPFRVFTPFWRHCLEKIHPQAPLPAPSQLLSPDRWPQSLELKDFKLEPHLNWAAQFPHFWQPGESGAQEHLARFCKEALLDYGKNRDIPAISGTSRLSPYLHWGELSVQDIWQALEKTATACSIPPEQWHRWQYVAELGWREFGYHLLHHFPHTPTEPLKPEFSAFPWHDHPVHQKAWETGKTGYPIVDAGMRELWQTGWMHNRVRMIVASFYVKDLLLPWQSGARWFWDTLVDADLASNTLGWQWSAGCGADAQPFFRIFNPILQGEKFDPQGDYIRRWVPELAKLPPQWIHQPWNAPDAILRKASVTLDSNYPAPIVNHNIARNVALEALGKIKKP